MEILFNKYQGTGNDFVIIDDRKNALNLSSKQVANMCDRRFGIGADGLMLLRSKEGYDFEMIYYNSDGNESTMCGNGGRCIVAFAQKCGVISESANFWAIDGQHKALINANGTVALGMINVDKVLKRKDDFELFTGSPHLVAFFTKNINHNKNFITEARAKRNSMPYEEEGINVNYVTKTDQNAIDMRTYERGVEDETYSCGTGAVAAAISTHSKYFEHANEAVINISTLGGNLKVSFSHSKGKYNNIKLIGPATFVFEGKIQV